MGGVLSYSGLSTKIRAMQSRLATEEQFQEIIQLSDVPQVVAYLKRTPEYAKIWSSLDENDLHRGDIEKLLKKSIFQNFARIYHFANRKQRNEKLFIIRCSFSSKKFKNILRSSFTPYFFTMIPPIFF